MRSSSSCSRIVRAIFSPMPGVCAISSGVAAAARRCRESACARLRAVTSPTSSMPRPNSTRANGRCLERLDRVDQVARRLLGEALELGQLLGAQPVEVAVGAHQPALLQQRHLLLAEALDVHRALRDEVLEQLPRARGAVAVGALREHALARLDGFGVTERASRRAAAARGGRLPARSSTCGAGETTWGITSPARITITSSPGRRSLRRSPPRCAASPA